MKCSPSDSVVPSCQCHLPPTSSSKPPNVLHYEFDRDEEEKAEVYRNRPLYSLPTKIGNWCNDLALQEEKGKQIVYKRNNCTLLAQKTRLMFKNVLRPTKIADEGPRVLYGQNYQLKASELPNKLQPDSGYKATYGLYLSGVINESDVQFSSHFSHGCLLTASPEKGACVRNTFNFVSCCGQEDYTPLYYGEDTYICICETGTDGRLYVQCENATFDDFGGPLKVRLTQSPNIYCRFKLLHWDPQWRVETDGGDIPQNTKVIIQHTASGRNLAASYTAWIPTFFGAEAVVTCRTLRDSHRMETAENMWQVVSAKTIDTSVFVRAAKGEEIPVDLLD